MAVLALTACMGDTPSFAFGAPELHTVRRGNLRITVNAQSALQAEIETSIRSKVKGWVGLLYLIPEGIQVEEGDELALLDLSKHEEYRAGQAIKVAKVKAALEQATKNLEIMETQLLAMEMTADSELRIAQMELEKFLGREADDSAANPSRAGEAGTNRDMVDGLEEMLDNEMLTNPEAEVEYSGLASEIRVLLGEEGLDRAMGQMANQVLAQIDFIRLAQAEMELRKETLEHSVDLKQKDFITSNELERDRLRFQSQYSRVTLAWNDIDLLINYTLQQDKIRLTQDVENKELTLLNTLATNEARRVRERAEVFAKTLEYEHAAERLATVDEQIANSVITAPHAGVVIYGKQGRDRHSPPIEEGSMIRERQKLVTLPDVSKLIAEFKVHESQIQNVEQGQSATLEMDAFPDRTFTGVVTHVAGLADPGSRWNTSSLKNYTVTVAIDGENTDEALRPGMNASMEILVDTVEDVLSVPMEAVRRDRQTHYVWKSTPAAPVATRVSLGRNNLTHVEIQEGVEVGDMVYLSPPLDVEPPTFDRGTAGDQSPAGLPAEEVR